MHHYLLLCTDTWDGDPNNLGNTDGVVLVTLDTVQRRVIFCTLTREMLIRRPDGAIGRFTYITKNYGIDALLNIVATQFGIKVDQYAIFCMNNIQDIIDALGGVTLTVTDAAPIFSAAMPPLFICASARSAATVTRAAPAVSVPFLPH